MLAALTYARILFHDATYDHMIDVLRALAHVNNPCESGCWECDEGCLDYQPYAPFIEYAPNDPFKTPELVPPGYSIPPWYRNAAVPIPGVLPGDAMVNGAAVLSPALPLSGFPRFRLNVTDVSEVEIEFVQIPLGGVALISIDSSLTNLKIVDLSTSAVDLLSLEGILELLGVDVESVGLVQTQVIELEISEPGAHTIDVTFLPTFQAELFVGFGGGIRRITLCGQNDMAYFQLRQNPDDPCLVEQLLQPDGEWIEAFRMDNCCCDDNAIEETRFTEDGIFQVYDGTQWVDAPERDPRLGAPQALPIGEKCAGADNIRDHFKDIRDQLIDLLNGGGGITLIIAMLIGALSVFLFATVVGTTWAIVIWSLAGALFLIGAAGVQAQLTDEVMEEFKCILFCRIGENGQFTADDIPGLLSEIDSRFQDFPHTFFYQITAALGHIGLNNMAALGASTADDCDDCQCGDLNCGFTTTHLQNSSRWAIAEELVNTAVFEKPIGLVVHTDGAPVFSALGNQTLAAYTEFEEPCYITTVSMTTLGRSNPGNITVAYKLFHGGEWIDSGTQSYATWAAATVKVFNINGPVVAIQIQSEAFNTGQNNITSVVIGDPTP